MNVVRRFLIACIDVIRPFLGSSNVCIYASGVSCGHYAVHLLKHKPLWLAIPRIAWRVFTCNPITILFHAGLRFSHRFFKKS